MSKINKYAIVYEYQNYIIKMINLIKSKIPSKEHIIEIILGRSDKIHPMDFERQESLNFKEVYKKKKNTS